MGRIRNPIVSLVILTTEGLYLVLIQHVYFYIVAMDALTEVFKIASNMEVPHFMWHKSYAMLVLPLEPEFLDFVAAVAE